MSIIYYIQGVNMDATLELRLGKVIEQLESLKDNSQSMISESDTKSDNQIWIDDVEQLACAISLIEVLKNNQDDLSKCIELLSLDGVGSKTTVKSILSTCIERLNTYTVI